MNFDWVEYLNLANELAGNNITCLNQEARFRSAISRAYYAVFCSARNYLRDVKKVNMPQSSYAHKFVENYFTNSNVKLKRKIGVDLNRLRIDRNSADYDDHINQLQKTTYKCLITANNILSLIQRSKHP